MGQNIIDKMLLMNTIQLLTLSTNVTMDITMLEALD